jgi:hypothetical protein
MDVVEQDHTQNLAHARDGLEEGHGVCVVLLGRRHEGQCDIAEYRVIAVTQSQIDCHAFGHGGIGKALGAPAAVRFGGDLLAHLGQVVLPVGLLAMGQELRACARQREAAPEQSTGCPHRCRGDVSLRDHAAVEQDGDCPGVNPVVFGGAALDGCHRQGLAQDKRQSFWCTQVGEPVPRQEALYRDDNSLPLGGHDLHKRLRARLHSAMPQDLAVVVEHTDVHGAGMEVDAAVKWMLLGVEAHEVSSSCE